MVRRRVRNERRNENVIDYLPAERAAMRAVIEALKILDAQWCFAEAYDLGDGMQGRTYRSLCFMTDSSLAEIAEDESKCGQAEVYVHKDRGKWVATSAEVNVPEGKGLFRFKWQDGRIIETQQIENQGIDWKMKVWDPQIHCLKFDPDYYN